MYTAGTKHLEEKERAYVNAMEQFRTRAMDRDRLTEVGKEYEEEVEKFEKENDRVVVVVVVVVVTTTTERMRKHRRLD